MHKFKFSEDDLFINRLKTYPEYNIFIYQGRMNINRTDNEGLSVYDINSNITSSGTDRVYPFVVSGSKKDVFKTQLYQPLVKNFSSDLFFIRQYSERRFSNRKISNYGQAFGVNNGESIYSSTYGSQVPISRRLTHLRQYGNVGYFDINNPLGSTNANVNFRVPINITASALQNVARKYTTLSPHFIFSGSTEAEKKYLNTFLGGRNLVNDDNAINYVFIPSMYYGSTIKKGSVELNYYITGSKIATCTDKNQNGVLIETTGSKVNCPVGLVLYDEGIIMLTASHALGDHGIEYDGIAREDSWLYYSTTLNDGTGSNSIYPTLSSASYDLNFKGTSYVNTMTMFAHARKGHLNHSNNPTYRDQMFLQTHTTGSGKIFVEGESPIANVVSASYVSASFEKTTYISKVHIYDEDGNLIAITSMAKPVKKTLNDEFTFKMKLDL